MGLLSLEVGKIYNPNVSTKHDYFSTKKVVVVLWSLFNSQNISMKRNHLFQVIWKISTYLVTR